MAEQEKEPLFPPLPEDLKALADDEVQKLLDDSVAAAALIEKDDEEFLAGLTGDEIIAELATGVEQIKALQAENKERLQAYENYKAEKAAKLAELSEDSDSGDEDDSDEAEATAEAEVVAEVEEAEEVVEETVEEPAPVVASAPAPRFSRTPPAPAPSRIVVNEPTVGTALVAAGGYRESFQGPLDAEALATLNRSVALEYGPAEKNNKKTYVDGPHGRAVFDGPRVKTARADYEFDGDRTLTGADDDLDKIRAVMPPEVTVFGKHGTMSPEALTASGGLCAPLTPIYTMPNFATEAEPVWDSLPVFRAARGGVNVPTPTSIADIETAISSISESDDALGGTFATKSCQDLTCPEYTETAVQILAHCREYGNLNARAWPEKIAHENALTMAGLSRVSEQFMLDRIKALSINVTQAAIGSQYGSFASLVHAIAKASAGIKFRLRMPRTTNFRVLLPSWIPDHLAADNAAHKDDRYLAQAALEQRLSAYRISVAYYLDDVTGGTSQGFAAEAAGALDEFPDDVQYAIYPEGQFLGIDSGSLELGIVRDSTLNSTNDFQVFGERFRNLAMLGPAQGALWVTQDICPTGSSAADATALTC